MNKPPENILRMHLRSLPKDLAKRGSSRKKEAKKSEAYHHRDRLTVLKLFAPLPKKTAIGQNVCRNKYSRNMKNQLKVATILTTKRGKSTNYYELLKTM